MNDDDIIYIELNNWMSKHDYPDEEPFLSWINPWNKETKEYDLPVFEDDDFNLSQKICVVRAVVDMSLNYCITATRAWVEKMCPRILNEEFSKFICHPEEDGTVYGRFGNEFLEYKEENFGLHEQTCMCNKEGKFTHWRKEY